MTMIAVKDAAGVDQQVQLPLLAGRAAAAASNPVALSNEDKAMLDKIADPIAAGENLIGKVGGLSAIVTGTIVRPADTAPYAVGDLIANSVTANAVTPVALTVARVNGGTARITRARLSTTKAGLAGTDLFRIHLFKLAPTADNGDNGAFLVNGIAAVHLGVFDVVLDRIFKDGAKGIAAPAVGAFITVDAAGGTRDIFALLEARGPYTPASTETFTIALEVDRD